MNIEPIWKTNITWLTLIKGKLSPAYMEQEWISHTSVTYSYKATTGNRDYFI